MAALWVVVQRVYKLEGLLRVGGSRTRRVLRNGARSLVLIWMGYFQFFQAGANEVLRLLVSVRAGSVGERVGLPEGCLPGAVKCFPTSAMCSLPGGCFPMDHLSPRISS